MWRGISWLHLRQVRAVIPIHFGAFSGASHACRSVTRTLEGESGRLYRPPGGKSESAACESAAIGSPIA